jgi:hypothetical protein
MASSEFLSKRVKKKSQTGLTTDRYEFLGLDQAEPDLGDPLVGLSSIGANPAPISGNQYVLIAASGNTGKRYWIAASQITGSGLIPGSFTIFNNNIQVGAANSFNKFNFVGTGVTVDFVGAAATEQTGVATVRITVTDLTGPGNVNSIPFKASNGLLAGATDFVYSSGSIGIGTTQPTETLEVVGSLKVSGTITGTATTATTALGFSTTANINTSGIITATTFVGSLTGTAITATTALGFSTTANINTSGIITATGGFVGSLTGTATTAVGLGTTSSINTSGIITATTFVGSLTGTATTATTALGFSTTANINTSGIITATGGFVGGLVGIASTATNLADASGITTGTIARARLSGTYDINITGSIANSGQTLDNLTVSGFSTFTNGPVVIGSGIQTGTSKLQVSGDTFITGSVGIGTTNPTSTLQVEGGGRFTGVVTATSFSGSGSNLTGLLSNTVSTSSTTVPQYIGFFTTTSGTITSNFVSSTLTYIPSSGNLGIGTTNPITPLQVETYGVKTGVGTFTASVGVSTTIDSFSVSSTDFKIAEYTVHIGVGSYIQAQKVLITQNQTTAYSQEYGVMYDNSLLVSIGATITGGNCILQATPQTGVSGLTTYRFARNTLL